MGKIDTHMRTVTTIYMYLEDKNWCKDHDVKLSYAFRKGVEFLKKGDNSEVLMAKIERLAVLLQTETIKRLDMEERYAKLALEFGKKTAEKGGN